MCHANSDGSGFVYTSLNSQCSAPSNYYLSSAATFSGNTNFLSPYGGYETGHRGNGFARITVLHWSSKYLFRLCNQYYSYFVEQRSAFIPLMSFIVFSLIEDGISLNLILRI